MIILSIDPQKRKNPKKNYCGVAVFLMGDATWGLVKTTLVHTDPKDIQAYMTSFVHSDHTIGRALIEGQFLSNSDEKRNPHMYKNLIEARAYWECCLRIMNVPCETIHPKSWQSKIFGGNPTSKEMKRLAPHVFNSRFSGEWVVSEHEIDAALIGAYWCEKELFKQRTRKRAGYM